MDYRLVDRDCWWLRNEDVFACQWMTSEGFSAMRGGALGQSHRLDYERGIYSESRVHGSGDWCDADPASMRDCKASHRGG